MNNLAEKLNVIPMDTNKALASTVMSNTYELWGKRIASVPVTLLKLDHSYQRTETGNAKKIADNWNDEACEFLIVSYRDGNFYVIDGQHRLIAAKIKGKESLPCVILTGLTRQEEARRFSVQGVGRKKLSPSDTFKANLECGNPKYAEVFTDMEIKRICDKYNIEITKSNFSNNPKKLRSISRPRIIVNTAGSECFEWIINTITESKWESCTYAYEKDFLMLFKTYYVEHKGDLETAKKKLIKMFNSITPEEFVIQARAENPTHRKNSAMKIKLANMIN